MCDQLTLGRSWPYHRLFYHRFDFDFPPITSKNSLAVAVDVDDLGCVLGESSSFNIERCISSSSSLRESCRRPWALMRSVGGLCNISSAISLSISSNPF